MAQASITIGNNTFAFTISFDSAKGLKYIVDSYNEQNKTSMNPAEYLAMTINNLAGDAASARRQAFRKMLMSGWDSATPQVQQQVLQILGVTEP